MAINYTTTPLIASVKRRISTPTSSQLYSDADFLAVLNEAQREIVVPAIKAARQHYFAAIQDTALVAGTAAYSIPAKAIAGSLVNVEIVDGSGNRTPLVELQPSQLWAYNGASTSVMFPLPSDRYGYYIQDNSIILQPAPTASGTLRMTFEKRRNSMVAVADAAQVLSINTGTGVITCTAAPPATMVVNADIDIIGGVSPFVFKCEDVNIDAAAGSTLTIATTTTGIGNIVAGDWIAIAGETPVAQMPYEAHDFLAQAAAVKVEESGGNPQFVSVAQARLNQIRADFLSTFVPRNLGSSRKIVNINGVF